MSTGKENPAESKLLELADVLAEELACIKGRPISDRRLENVFEEFHAAGLSALCFSGGGIRSATFGLGIVQALARHGLLDKFDYLSTVSGGGYLGSWISAWVLREKLACTKPRPMPINVSEESNGTDEIEGESPALDRSSIEKPGLLRDLGIAEVQRKINCGPIAGSNDPNPEPTQLKHLREFSNYMSPKVGMLSTDTWTLIAIYVRNLFLNLTIFIPLIAAVLLLPRLLFRVIIQDEMSGAFALGTLIVGALAGSFAMAFVISRLPSKNRRFARGNGGTFLKNSEAENPGLNTDSLVMAFGVVPLVIAAFAVSAFCGWNYRAEGKLDGYFNVFNFDLAANPDLSIVYFVGVCVAAYAIGLLIFLVLTRFKSFDLHGVVAAFVSSVVGGALLWLVSQKLFAPERIAAALGQPIDRFEWQTYQMFSVPVFLLIFLISATVFVGLSSRSGTDDDREWLARYGALTLIVIVFWILLNALVLLGPSLLQWTYNFNWRDLLTISGLPAIVSVIIAVASGAISVLGAFSEKALVRNEQVKTKTSQFLAYAPRIGSVLFLGFFLIGLAHLTTLILYSASGLFESGFWLTFPSTTDHVTALDEASAASLFGLFLFLALIGVVMAFFVNVNKFSLHGAYRDRLVSAYLGASNPKRKKNTFTGFDESDNFQLHRLKDQRPFHIINATLNLINGKTLAWQQRKAASFTMSPLHCGSWTLGYRHSNKYCRGRKLEPCKDIDTCNRFGTKCESIEKCALPGKAMRLGTAMAISGAAANPNMGYYSSSIVTFLMSLFNVRLGWWLGNTGETGGKTDLWGDPYYSKASPSIAVLPLMNETLGLTDASKRYINVTDGGHFENLALYEMVLRRCRFILLSDGAADESFKFGEISNAIQKCKVDLGVDIKFLGGINIRGRYSPEEGEVKRLRFAIAEITYPEKTEAGENLKGYILYTRPTYYGTTEPTDIRYYADSHRTFPHQSTGDQMYDEKQFEAYRSLGFMTIQEIVNHRRLDDLDQLRDLLKEDLNLPNTSGNS